MQERFRVTVPLSKQEFVALSLAAQGDYRNPRDQARYMLRAALGLHDDPVEYQEMHNGGASLSQGTRAAVAATSIHHAR